MTRSELTKELAKDLNVEKEFAKDILDSFITIIVEALKNGEEVKISNFGTFYKTDLKSRTVTIPNTDKKATTKASSIAKFRSGSILKSRLN